MKNIIAFVLTVLAASVYAQTVDNTAYQRYVNVDLIGTMVPGYYIQGSKKVDAKIKYLAPADLQLASVPFTINQGNGEEVLPKSKINAISMDNQIYVPEDLGDSVVWVMLTREGAIRETIYFMPEPVVHPKYYKVNHLVTNTNTHEGYFVGSLAVNFNKIMASLTADNEEISKMIQDRAQGYRFIDYQKIIAEYNLWFQNTYPKRVKFIGEVPDYQSIIDNDVSKYLPKN